MATPGKTTHSPSNSLSSSISVVSPPHSLNLLTDDLPEDQVVWSGSNSCIIVKSYSGPECTTELGDDDDFVLLSHSSVDTSIKSECSVNSSVESLLPGLQNLSIDPKSTPRDIDKSAKSRRNRHRNIIETDPRPVSQRKNSSEKQLKATTKASGSSKKIKNRSSAQQPSRLPRKIVTPPKQITESLGLGERPIVDDISEFSAEPSFYENAVQVMGSVISSEGFKTSVSRLSILQALLVELGVVDSEMDLPTTLSSAKALLRSKVFVNIRDYVAAREQGLEALRRVMYNSRGSLVRDLRRKKKQRAPLAWVKDSGLSVLLVSCY